MDTSDIIHDGVSIKIYSADEPDKVVISFTDDITAFYKIKKAVINGKGIWCNNISSMISRALQREGIPTYFIRQLNETQQLCYKVDVIQMEVIVRNVIAGSLSQRLGLAEGTVPAEPIIDLCYKNTRLGDPLINEHHAIALGLLRKSDLGKIYELTTKINNVLVPIFKSIGITLVDFKIEFGRMPDGSIVMADDITPDSARFWDIETGDRLDKDRFRNDSGRVGYAYQTVYERLKTLNL